GRADNRMPGLFRPRPIGRPSPVHFEREHMLNRAAQSAASDLEVLQRIGNRTGEPSHVFLKQRCPMAESLRVFRTAGERRGFAAHQPSGLAESSSWKRASDTSLAGTC